MLRHCTIILQLTTHFYFYCNSHVRQYILNQQLLYWLQVISRLCDHGDAHCPELFQSYRCDCQISFVEIQDIFGYM